MTKNKAKSVKVDCPKCFGTKQFMQGHKHKGFKYEDCNFCDENGKVEEELADDYALSLNEDNIENEDYE